MHRPSRSRLAAFAALAVALLACLAAPSKAGPVRVSNNGIGGPTTFIIGGSTAQAAEYPSVAYLVSLLPNPDDPTNKTYLTATCTGTLVQSRPVPVLLTAAHCLRANEEVLAVRAYVGAGTSDLTCGNQTSCREFRLKALHAHPQYVPAANGVDKTGHDAALWELEQIDGRDLPPAAPMNGDAAFPAVGAPSVAVGWGLTNPGGSSAANKTSAHTLQKVTLAVADNAKCESAFGYLTSTRPLVGCIEGAVNAAGVRTATCQGDSGGPHFVNGLLWAVTSSGPVPCDNGRPMVLVRTSGIKTWVESTLAAINAANYKFQAGTVVPPAAGAPPANATGPAAPGPAPSDPAAPTTDPASPDPSVPLPDPAGDPAAMQEEV